MKFDEYLQDEFTPHRLPSSWVTQTKFVFQSDDGSLAILDTANDSVTTLVTNHTMVSIIINSTLSLGWINILNLHANKLILIYFIFSDNSMSKVISAPAICDMYYLLTM